MEITLEEKGLIVHGTAGALMGVASGYMGTGAHIGLIAIGVLYGVWMIFQKVFKLDPEKHGRKWWFGNGVWPFFIFWLFLWALVYYIRTG